MNLYNYAATVNRVVDGDTLDLTVDLGFRIQHGLRLRLLGINTPELNTREGHVAKEFVQHLLPVGAQVHIHTEKPAKSFDRWLAHVTLSDGSDLAQRIRDEGLASD